MLQLKNICYDVDADRPDKARRILSDVSLDFPERTVTVITGHNGSGKSTLIKLIMGIDRPTSGRVLFNGEDITDASVTERALKGFTIAFQQPVRFKGITVRDLLGAACRKKTRHGRGVQLPLHGGSVRQGLHRPPRGRHPLGRRAQAHRARHVPR